MDRAELALFENRKSWEGLTSCDSFQDEEQHFVSSSEMEPQLNPDLHLKTFKFLVVQ